MLVAHYKTKKELKASIGKELSYSETSVFGLEYPADGHGCVTVVGPAADKRKFFAEVEVHDNKIVKVK